MARAGQLYTLSINKGTTWRIYHQKKGENENGKCGDDESEEYEPREAISQYHFYESTSAESTSAPPRLIKSFPYHHCLILASLDSTQNLIVRDNIYSRLPHTTHTSARLALAHIHDKKRITPFVLMTAYQKVHLTCLAAMTGVVVSRLFGISSAKRHTIRCLKKHADATSRCVHSALASEYLIGNRYYYNLPTVLSDNTHVVGKLPNDIKCDDIPDEDVTYEKIKENRSRLVKLYHSNIDRLEYAVQQFRRGLVSLQSIREDPEFATMFEMFWLVQTQSSKQYKNWMTTGLTTTRQAFCESNGIAFDRKSINIHVCNIIFSCQVVCPKLFSYDIAHLFDNKCQSYIKYVKTVRSKQLQLSNEGLNSSFLAFSAIEPRMVSMKLAPHIEEKTVWNPCSDLANYMNHIQSRDEIFGTLLCKHRFHIQPRRVHTIERTFFITKNNDDCFYLSIQDVLEELRTGKKSSKTIWKKNKRNFVPFIDTDSCTDSL